MLQATTKWNNVHTGDKGSPQLKKFLNRQYFVMEKIRADGEELAKCCSILGRNLPPPDSNGYRTYTFLGINAEEIALNWD